ncbi:MAG: DUF2059 domain-containing protein [Pseudomonadota bacterium]
MKHIFSAALLGVWLVTPAMAQDTRSLAEEYVNLPAVQDMMDDMFSPEAMAIQFRAGLPPNVPITDAQVGEIAKLLSRELDTLRPRFSEVLVASATEVMTAEELEAMIGFYSTDVGASILRKTQTVMSVYMQQLGPEIAGLQQRILPEVAQILQAQ